MLSVAEPASSSALCVCCRVVPFADLQLISLAATPGGLCQLLSNPLTCLNEQDKASNRKSMQFFFFFLSSLIRDGLPESQQTRQLCQMILSW